MKPRCRSTAGSITCPPVVPATQATRRSSPWFSSRRSQFVRSSAKNGFGSGPGPSCDAFGRLLSRRSVDLDRGARRRSCPASARVARSAPPSVDQDRVAELELAAVDHTAACPRPLEADRTARAPASARPGTSTRLRGWTVKSISDGTGYDCHVEVETSSPRIDRPLSNGRASAVGSLG